MWHGIARLVKWFLSDIRPFDVVLYKTNDCEPFEWTPESLTRFGTLVRFWKDHGPFRLVLSGGLENEHGTTIATAILEEIARQLPEALPFILQEQDHLSSDTAAEVREVTPIFRRYAARLSAKKPRLWVLSNFWHTRRLWLMFAFKGILIRTIISPTSGGIGFRLKRFVNEIILLALTVIDPNYAWIPIFERERRRRESLAKSRDLRYY